MNFVFWIDPIDNIDIHKDTSYILMLEAQRRGYHVFIVYENDIYLKNDQVYFHCQEVQIVQDETKPIQIIQSSLLSESKVECFFIRKEPPFNKKYIEVTWLLSLIQSNVLVINNPFGVRNVSEKIWTSGIKENIKEYIPKTLITANKQDFIHFLEQYDRIILKPIDAFGGKSIFLVSKNDTNAIVAFETLSQDGTQHIIVQEYIQDSTIGDKRIIIFNGDIIGQFIRVHSQTEHRNNISAGGGIANCSLTEVDTKIVEAISPILKKYGLYFVGLDVIGQYLIEINVTSPMGLQQINQLYNIQSEQVMMQKIENMIREKSYKKCSSSFDFYIK